MKKPKIVELRQIGHERLGYIAVAEENISIPFDIKRVYWTYHTPDDIKRGGHAHKTLEQVIYCVSGSACLKVENILGEKETFVLDRPNNGLYLPPLIWRDIEMRDRSVLLCIASELYNEDDYVRNYQDFVTLQQEYILINENG